MKRHLSILLAILMAFMFLSCEPDPVEKVKVTIDLGIGEPEIIEVDKGSEYTIPEKTREGRTVQYVLDNAGKKHAVGDKIIVTADIKLTWVWDKYLVTIFDGSDKTETLVNNGSDYTFPDFVEKEGKWASYVTDTSGNKLAFSTIKEVKEDRTYTIVRASEPYRIDPNKGTIIAYLGAETEVTLPTAVAGITITGVDSFNADAVTKVVIPESYKTIGNSAFKGLSKLKNVSFPSTLESIGERAFVDTGLTSVDISNTKIETLEKWVFYTSNLTTLKLPKTLKTIESESFKGPDTGSITVAIPESVDSVAYDAFYSRTDHIVLQIKTKEQTLTWNPSWMVFFDGKIEWGDTKTIGDFTVREIKNTDNTNAYEIVSGTHEGTTLTIPENLNGVPVIAIADMAFKGDRSFEELVISDSVKTVGTMAFWNCLIKKLTFSQNLESIGKQAFGGALIGMMDITFPDSLRDIGQEAFRACQFGNVVINNGIENIGKEAFFMSTINTITFKSPSSLKTIGEKTFREVNKLENIVLPEGVTSIGESTFYNGPYNSSALKSVSLPSTLDVVPASMFQGCKALETVTFNGRITDIGYWAFMNCTALKQLDLPESLEKISGHRIIEGTAIESLSIPEKVSMLHLYAFMNSSVKEITFSSTVPPQIIGESKPLVLTQTVLVPKESLEAYKAWAPTYGFNPENVKAIPET